MTSPAIGIIDWLKRAAASLRHPRPLARAPRHADTERHSPISAARPLYRLA